MRISEEGGAWRDIPPWVTFLVHCGFHWPSHESATRRIGLVSMPCDSAAVGLVALGAMRRRLEFAAASEVASHFQRIVDLARRRDTAVHLRRGTSRERYVVDGIRDAGTVWVSRVSSSTVLRRLVTESSALQWYFDGEAAVQVVHGDRLPYEEFYRCLVAGGAVIADNLARSDSGVCIAGRVSGGSDTRRILSAMRFQTDGAVADLAQLVSVFGWSGAMVSRISFFNSRTEGIDRNAGAQRLVVADGIDCMLKVLDRIEFQNASVIGVIHRTVDRAKSEELSAKLGSLGQWYELEPWPQRPLEPPPRGVLTAVWRRR